MEMLITVYILVSSDFIIIVLNEKLFIEVFDISWLTKLEKISDYQLRILTIYPIVF